MPKLLTLLFAFFSSVGLLAQNGSSTRREIPETNAFPAQKDTAFSRSSPVPVLTLNSRKTSDLKILGLVWGFLKYYHPAIAEGRYNWDNELFRFLPQYIAGAEDTAQRNAMLYAWVKSLGRFEVLAEVPFSGKARLKPDLGWIATSGFSAPLRDVLLQVQRAKRPPEHYYVRLTPGVQNPVFRNEIAYENAVFPDAGMQLLALYRYWNMVQYFFPYKNLIGEDWKEALPAFIPRFAALENDTAYTLLMQELIGRIHDTHAQIKTDNLILKSYFGIYYPPLALAMLDSQLVVAHFLNDSLGAQSGLQPGDVLTTINGQAVESLFESKNPYLPASNPAVRNRSFARAALRSNDSAIAITYVRKGVAQTARLALYNLKTLYPEGQPTKSPSFRMLSGNIAYVNNGLLRRDSLPEIWPQIAAARALIIDDRNYPADFVLHDFCKYLLPKPTIFYQVTRPSLLQPGLFMMDTPPPVGKKNKDFYKGKVAILVNEETQSSAEFHAMAYQAHPHAKVVGSTTAGADGNISEIVLPGAVQTLFSGIGIYYPDGRETQRTGIAIDIWAQPTATGLAAGKDEVLERALEWVASGP